MSGGMTYEEALSTLTSMFAETSWTQDSLDQVLRYHEGHMENTIETILSSGDERPDLVVQRLKASVMQGASDVGGSSIAVTSEPSPAPAVSSPTKDKSLPKVTLPPEFLRIPGQQAQAVMDADEQLARMLQEEDFLRQLENDQDLRQLAAPASAAARQRRVANRTNYPGASNNSNGPSAEDMGKQVMEKLSGLGDAAKQKFSMLAAKFNEARATPNQMRQERAERTGLLDHNNHTHTAEEEEFTFNRSPNNNVEMQSFDKKSD